MDATESQFSAQSHLQSHPPPEAESQPKGQSAVQVKTPPSHPKRPSIDKHRSSSSQNLSSASKDRAHEHSSDSPPSTPPTAHRSKSGKALHVVGRGLGARVPSHGSKIHKLGKAHIGHKEEVHATAGGVGATRPNVHRRVATTSPTSSPRLSPMKRVGSEGKLSRVSSGTDLTHAKKNSSALSLKRNRSTAEVKRNKSAGNLKRSHSEKGMSKGLNKTSVHFDLGNDGQDDEGWTEASGSASPNLSRSGSIGGASSGRNSAKPPASAANSQLHSPAMSYSKAGISEGKEWTDISKQERATPDAQQITNRLLQRTSSHNAPPKMSSISATATPTTPGHSGSPDLFVKTSAMNTGTSQTSSKEQGPITSRFIDSASGTPADSPLTLVHRAKDPRGANSPFNPSKSGQKDGHAENPHRKSKSMANLTSHEKPNKSDSSDEDRPLAPRSRKGSIPGAGAAGQGSGSAGNFPHPAQASRTQQKLWLQRASSNIEPQQLGPSAAMSINGFPALVPNASPLVSLGSIGLGSAGGGLSGHNMGVGYDGRDPRVRLQIERTGAEYLVVRRYQNPVGRALKRLARIKGNEGVIRVPGQGVGMGMARKSTLGMGGYGGPGFGLGLSQSLRERERERERERDRERDKIQSQRSRSRVNNGNVHPTANGARSSYEDGSGASNSLGSGTSVRDGDVVGHDEEQEAGDGDADGVDAILRSLWEKNMMDLSASTD